MRCGLAERLGGVVINADSMQVYRELRILTARPTPEEEARAPHALYGFVGGAEAYSAGRYAADAARAIAEARARARAHRRRRHRALLQGAAGGAVAGAADRSATCARYWRGAGRRAARARAARHAGCAATPRWPRA